jgi:hypothetical protein
MTVIVPKPQKTDYEKLLFATEIAYKELVIKAVENDFLSFDPGMAKNLAYLPDQAISQRFKEVCRDILNLLKKLEEESKSAQNIDDEQGQGVE